MAKGRRKSAGAAAAPAPATAAPPAGQPSKKNGDGKGDKNGNNNPARTFSRFTFATYRRSQLHPAPYNPRYLDASARNRLKRLLKKHGLVEPIVVNSRDNSNTVTGGHQRLSIMDELSGYLVDGVLDTARDYDVPVALIDVSPDEEKAINLSLNNVSAQGIYDLDRLESVIVDLVKGNPSFDLSASTGFERADLALMLAPESLAKIFPNSSLASQATAESPIAAELAEMHAAGLRADRDKRQADKSEQAGQQGGQQGESTGATELTTPPEKNGDDSDPTAKASYDNYRSQFKARENAPYDHEFYLILEFPSRAHVDAFLTAGELDIESRHHDGLLIAEKMGLVLEEVPADEGQSQETGQPQETGPEEIAEMQAGGVW